jgi:uncharacterized protein YjbI with pentapeptide repeats
MVMANPEHVAKLKEGVEVWNKWRESHPEIERPDLSFVDFTSDEFKNTALYRVDELGKSVIYLHTANLRGAEFDHSDLGNAELFGADLRATFFGAANLQGADLQGADLRGAGLLWTNLRGARLTQADLGETNVTGVIFDYDSRATGYYAIRVSTCWGSQISKSFAQDQDYIEELRSSGRWGSIKFWIWWLFADCGRSFGRWAAWSLAFALAFGVLYFWMGPDLIATGHLPFSLKSMIYYSVVTFTTLGFGDITPKTENAAMVVMAEVILGYIMLGGLISIFANKVARRS